ANTQPSPIPGANPTDTAHVGGPADKNPMAAPKANSTGIDSIGPPPSPLGPSNTTAPPPNPLDSKANTNTPAPPPNPLDPKANTNTAPPPPSPLDPKANTNTAAPPPNPLDPKANTNTAPPPPTSINFSDPKSPPAPNPLTPSPLGPGPASPGNPPANSATNPGAHNPVVIPPTTGNVPTPSPTTSAPGAPIVRDWAVKTFTCTGNETSFADVSRVLYGDEKYGKALLLYNRSYPLAGDHVRQDPPRLQSNAKVVYPPVEVLQANFPGAINDAVPRMAAGTPAPAPGPAPGPSPSPSPPLPIPVGLPPPPAPGPGHPDCP